MTSSKKPKKGFQEALPPINLEGEPCFFREREKKRSKAFEAALDAVENMGKTIKH